MKIKPSELLACVGCLILVAGCSAAFAYSLANSKPEYRPAPAEHVRSACDAGDDDACKVLAELLNAEGE